MAFHELFAATKGYAVKASDGTTAFTEGDSLTNQIDGSTAEKSLAEGSIAIFNEDGKVIMSAASPLIARSNFVRFAVGQGFTDGVGSVLLGELIPRNAIVNYKAYAAGTDNVQYVGAEDVAANTPIGSLSLPAVLTEGESAGIQVRLTERLTELIPVNYTYNTTVRNGDTAATILGRLIIKINKEEKYTITAAIIDTDKGISITTKENVSIGVFGVLEWASVITANTTGAKGAPTLAKPAQNSIESLKLLETKATADQGNTDYTSADQYNIWKVKELFEDDTKEFNVINVSWDLRPVQIGESIRRVQKPSLAIAADSSTNAGVGVGKLITVIDPILTAIFATSNII